MNITDDIRKRIENGLTILCYTKEEAIIKARDMRSYYYELKLLDLTFYAVPK